MPLELRVSVLPLTLTWHLGPAPASALPTLLLSPMTANLSGFPDMVIPLRDGTACTYPPRGNPSGAPPLQCQGPARLRAARGRHLQGKGVWQEVCMKAGNAGSIYFSNGHQRCCALDPGGKAEPNREEKALHPPQALTGQPRWPPARSLALLPVLCLHIRLNLTQPPVIRIMPILQMGTMRLRKTKWFAKII